MEGDNHSKTTKLYVYAMGEKDALLSTEYKLVTVCFFSLLLIDLSVKIWGKLWAVKVYGV